MTIFEKFLIKFFKKFKGVFKTLSLSKNIELRVIILLYSICINFDNCNYFYTNVKSTLNVFHNSNLKNKNKKYIINLFFLLMTANSENVSKSHDKQIIEANLNLNSKVKLSWQFYFRPNCFQNCSL